MDPLLALIRELYASVAQLREENTQLKEELKGKDE